MASKRSNNIFNMVLCAMFLALAYVLPFLTGMIPQIGAMFLPMHIPVILCGYFCGPFYGLFVGLTVPLLRSLTLGMPTFYPNALGMMLELATYGFVAGFLYKYLPKSRISIFVSLISSLLIGRVIWGVSRLIMLGISGTAFSWSLFIAGAFLNAWPGIIIQLVLIPFLVSVLQKYTFKYR